MRRFVVRPTVFHTHLKTQTTKIKKIIRYILIFSDRVSTVLRGICTTTTLYIKSNKTFQQFCVIITFKKIKKKNEPCVSPTFQFEIFRLSPCDKNPKSC